MCELPSEPFPRVRIPALRATELSEVVLFYGVALVAGVPGERTTHSCVDELLRDVPTSFEGCVLAQAVLPLGPTGPLLEAIEAGGIDLSELTEADRQLVKTDRQPNFHPEVARLVLREYGPGLTISQEITALPWQTTTLPAGIRFRVGDADDPRDAQQYLAAGGVLAGSDESRVSTEQLASRVFGTDPDVIEFSSVTTKTADRFELLIVLLDSRGGIAWETFDFEVED